MPEIYPLIVSALTENFGLVADEIHPGANFNELGLDSLALVELSIIVQERIGIQLDDVDKNATLAEIAAYLETAIAERAAGAEEPRPAAQGAGSTSR